MSTSFIGLFHGPDFQSARIITTSTDPTLVKKVAAELLDALQHEVDNESDPVTAVLNDGRRNALLMISMEDGAATNPDEQSAPPLESPEQHSGAPADVEPYCDPDDPGWRRSEMRPENWNGGTFSGWCRGCNRQAILIGEDGALIGHDGPCRDRWDR